MKKLLLLIMAFLAIMIGCSDDAVQTDIIDTAGIDAQMMENYLQPLMNYNIRDHYPDYQLNFNTNRGTLKTKTLKIRQTGNMMVLPPLDGGCLESEAFVVVEGEGNVSHMGRTSVYISYCTDDQYGLTSPYEIFGNLTAANGDQLFSKLNYAEVDLYSGIGTQVWEVIDGSGRFDGAIGEITLYIQFNFNNYTWSNTGVGTITY